LCLQVAADEKRVRISAHGSEVAIIGDLPHSPPLITTADVVDMRSRYAVNAEDFKAGCARKIANVIHRITPSDVAAVLSRTGLEHVESLRRPALPGSATRGPM